MDIDKREAVDAADLRRRAEEILLSKTTDQHSPSLENDALKLAHELHVYQIELEMQNAELRQSRDEAETALERYIDLYDFAPVGYFTLDRNGAITAANLSGAALLGNERTGLLGLRFKSFVPVNARSFFTDFLESVYASPDKKTFEVTLTTGGNSAHFVRIEALSVMSGQECRLAVIDLTERRSAEKALIENRHNTEELNKLLELRVVKAVEELRRKDQMLILQDRLAVMGEMINNIAHQWRQPLNTLGLLIQQLPIFYDLGSFSREILKENSTKSMELIRHMSQTIDDFKDFFIPDKEIVAFSVNQVIEQTLSLVKQSFKGQKIDIVLHIEGDPLINGYPNEYAQVLLNILMNARDALVEHNVDDALISIRAFSESGNTVVTITDNAGGVAEEIMDKLFDSNFTTKGPDKGTGIGLFMSKTIIEKNMGGSLTVRNAGSGAEFRIEV
jgi:PAS domain S-box-containing protein